jgi:hypothetical protein
LAPAKFVIVGGVASQVYGSTRVTKDLDLCPAWLRRTSSASPLRCGISEHG